MKSLKLLFFIGAILIYLNTSVAYAQELVYIEVYENNHKNFPPKIIIVTPEDEIQIVPLNLIQYYYKDGETGNAALIKKELEKWILKGFEIKTSDFSTMGEGSVFAKYTTYLLVKN